MKTLAISRSRIVRSCRAFLPAASFMLLLLLPASCERRPLMEQSNNVYLDLELDTDIVNYEVTGLPDVMKVNFYHPDTEELLYEDFTEADGGPLGVPPGTYDIVVYNFGTESTIIRGEDTHSGAEAYSGEISDFMKGQLTSLLSLRAANYASKGDEVQEETIVNTPDHLWVAREFSVTVPVQVTDDPEPYVISTKASTVVETYTIDIREITGGQYISTVSALLSGMVESNFIGNNIRSENPVTLYIELSVDESGTSLSGKFNTFGKFPGARSELTLDLLVTDTGGGEHVFTWDITDQFDDNDEQRLEVIDQIDIPAPDGGGGGLDPDVDDWDDIESDIII